VHTGDLQVLLLRRVAPFNFWQSVTGSLSERESPADAAARELVEETGLSVEGRLHDVDRRRVFTIDRRWRDRFAPGVTENLEHEWHYTLGSTINVTLDPAEHSEWQWVPIDEAIERVWSWTNREALESLRAVRR